jgi:hypothetical protein
MKNRRLVTWLFVSVFVGIFWGVWQGGILQGGIYGGIVFMLLLAYEGYLSIRGKS